MPLKLRHGDNRRCESRSVAGNADRPPPAKAAVPQSPLDYVRLQKATPVNARAIPPPPVAQCKRPLPATRLAAPAKSVGCPDWRAPAFIKSKERGVWIQGSHQLSAISHQESQNRRGPAMLPSPVRPPIITWLGFLMADG